MYECYTWRRERRAGLHRRAVGPAALPIAANKARCIHHKQPGSELKGGVARGPACVWWSGWARRNRECCVSVSVRGGVEAREVNDARAFLCLGLDKSIERQHAPPSAEQSKAGRLVALIDRSTNRLTPFTRSQMPIHPNRNSDRYGSNRWRVVVSVLHQMPQHAKTQATTIHPFDRSSAPSLTDDNRHAAINHCGTGLASLVPSTCVFKRPRRYARRRYASPVVIARCPRKRLEVYGTGRGGRFHSPLEIQPCHLGTYRGSCLFPVSVVWSRRWLAGHHLP